MTWLKFQYFFTSSNDYVKRYAQITYQRMEFPHFYFLLKVLISCTENTKYFIEVLHELRLLIHKKLIFSEKKIQSVNHTKYKFVRPHW
jgi:hypothetical protein